MVCLHFSPKTRGAPTHQRRAKNTSFITQTSSCPTNAVFLVGYHAAAAAASLRKQSITETTLHIFPAWEDDDNNLWLGSVSNLSCFHVNFQGLISPFNHIWLRQKQQSINQIVPFRSQPASQHLKQKRLAVRRRRCILCRCWTG